MMQPVNLPAYQLRVTSPVTGLVVRVIPLVNSYALTYERKLNEVTACTFTLPYSDRDYALFNAETNPDLIIDVQRTDPDGVLQTESSYLLRQSERLGVDGDDRLVMTGLHVNDLIRRRVIDPSDDSVQPNGGFATKAGQAGNIIRAYIREQAGDLASTRRQTLGLTVPPVSVPTVDVGGNFRFENLWDEVVRIAEQADIGIEVRHTGARNFECIIGTIGENKSLTAQVNPPFNTVVFDPDYGNLTDGEYIIDRREEITYAIVQGKGARDNRIRLDLQAGALTDSPYNRIEQAVDARDIDDTDAYQRFLKGLRFLVENRLVRDFEGKPLSTSGGAIYRRNWQFGDIVTLRWGSAQIDLRVIGIEFEVEGDDEDISIELGNI